MEQIPLGGPFRLVAEVFHGDAEQPQRLWVCVRAPEPASAAWIGCWSKQLGSQDNQGTEFALRELAKIAHAGVVAGPRGPVLTEHFFITGWQTWGPGTPAPLKELR